MTKKKKAIEAIEFLIEERYNKGNADALCLLCEIYNETPHTPWYNICKGCINMVFSKDGINTGCSERLTFSKWEDAVGYGYTNAEFWTKALIELKKVPAKYFTPSGWSAKPFKFLIELDNKIAEKHNLL